MHILGSLGYVITAQTSDLKSKLGDAKNAMGNADKAMKDAGKNISASSKEMSNAAGGNMASLQQSISVINPATGQAMTGMKNMSLAAKALNVALGPIGLAILAIGAAVTALTKYFKGSVDGQMKWAEIMGYISGITSTFRDAVIQLGRWLVWAFEHPQQAVKDLWEIIKTNVINRFNGLINMVTSGWTVISQGAKGVGLAIAGIFNKEKREEAQKSFKEMTQGLLDFGKATLLVATGVDDIGNKLKGTGGKAIELSKAMHALAKRENALRMDQINSLTEIAKLDADIANLRLTANDDTTKTVDAIEAMNQAMKSVEKKFNIQHRQAKEIYEIYKAKNALDESTIEDEEKEKQLEADLLRLEQARDSEMRSMLRRYNTLVNLQKSEEKARLDAIEAERKEKEKAIQEELDARNNVLQEIEEVGLTEIELAKRRMQEMLDAHAWAEEERARITKHWEDAISDINKKTVGEREWLMEEANSLMTASFIDLAGMMGNVFGDIEDGFKGLVGSMLGGVQQIINAMLSKAIAGVIAGEATKGLPGLITAAIGISALKSLWSSQVPQMQHGGVVPPGYPHDSYPAMLTSGEMVLPPRKLSSAMSGEVRFVIEDDMLVGILNKYGNKNNTY